MSYRILACGSNGSFQLGTGDSDDHDSLVAVQIPENSRPVQFAFGGNHTLVLFEDGKVYASGDNQHGQCGVKGLLLLEKFTAVPGTWKKIAAGWEYSVLLSQNGAIFTCGHGPKGELGLGPGTVQASELTKVNLPDTIAGNAIVDVKSSISHVVVRLDCGRFVGWGACRKGQLGTPEHRTMASGRKTAVLAVWEPRVLEFAGDGYCLGRDRTILYGEDGIAILGHNPGHIECRPVLVKAMWSSVHYTGRPGESEPDNASENNEEASQGISESTTDNVSSTHLQSIPGNEEDGPGSSSQNTSENQSDRRPDKGPDNRLDKRPDSSSQFSAEPISKIKTMSITAPGPNLLRISSHGNNLHGQLFLFETDSPIVDFEVGSEHGLVLLANNKVYAWGWGEHGNCGAKSDSVTYDYLSLVYSGPHPVQLLACGLATTWLVVAQ